MNVTRLARSWFLAPPVTGIRAVIYSLGAVALPTIIRASVQGPVSDAALLAYVPFILLAALAVEWQYAAAVALASALLGTYLFIEPRFVFMAGPTDTFSVILFLIGSALIIKLVHDLKGVLVDVPGSPAARHRGGIVFSAEAGDAWASWQGHSCSVRLGSQEEVAEMMQDFLAQRELGKRLSN
jgi:hypothetical protein